MTLMQQRDVLVRKFQAGVRSAHTKLVQRHFNLLVRHLPDSCCSGKIDECNGESWEGASRMIGRRTFGKATLGAGLLLGTGRSPALAQGRRDLRVGLFGG